MNFEVILGSPATSPNLIGKIKGPDLERSTTHLRCSASLNATFDANIDALSTRSMLISRFVSKVERQSGFCAGDRSKSRS